MSRFAVVVIEMPLDGGTIEDAQALADAIKRRGISDTPFDVSQGAFRPYGRMVSVTIEDREPGAMGRVAAQALLSAVDRGGVPLSDEDDEEDDDSTAEEEPDA